MQELAGNEAVNPGFRLWLSSMPSPAFPPSVLHAGLKLAVQPPCGVRTTLARTYAVMTDEAFEASPSRQPGVWKTLLLGISFFHAVVQVTGFKICQLSAAAIENGGSTVLHLLSA